MSESEHWFTNGICKSAPSIFTQIYTIYVMKFNTKIPVVFVLLPDKCTVTYSYLIKTLKSHIPVNPKTIITDLEQSAIMEFKEHFSNIISRGCHFHLNQCVLWRIQYMYSNTIITSPCLCTNLSDVIASLEHLCESDYYIEHE